ncbi:unnamed protein product [Rotaria magnacalcarata]|uniref:Uncharacterized protein n=1 Tax=Rotaria magnacalcarata TaxID=392030 RepID=A0A8S2QH95_9BILA|nr:unnamed protein product [Rotaria magnacalcarata]
MPVSVHPYPQVECTNTCAMSYNHACRMSSSIIGYCGMGLTMAPYKALILILLSMARKNMSVYKKWETIFPSGISKCLWEYWKERMSTPPLDPRFPNVNQTKRCWVNYVDYHRCMEMKNDEKVCSYFKYHYKELCPTEWIDKWDDQMAREVFPGIHD